MTIPWVVRVAMAFHDYGKPVPDHLLMCIQYVRNAGGCPSCGRRE